ncbi:MAG: HlyD family efflux transporter periplasmic adaptor subunit [Bacteroidota bacterium]
MKEDNIEYLSSEVQEILGTPPSWVTTWGTSIITSVVATLVLVGFFFKYPDIIKGDLTLTTSDPPVPVMSPHTGYLADLKVREGDLVKKGDLMAVFATTADMEDVLTLEREVDRLSKFDFNSLRTYRPNLNLQLGEISPTFASFVSVFDNLPFAENTQLDRAAINALERHIQQLERTNQSLTSKRETASQEIFAYKKQFDSATEQYKNSANPVDAPKVFETNAKVTAKESEKISIQTEMEKNREEIWNQRAKILEMQVQQAAGNKEKIYQLKQSLSNLKDEIRRWKEQYLLIAPSDGEVSFFANVSEQQYLKKGDQVLAVVSKKLNNNYVGQVRLPVKGSGKVEKGQHVNIKFESYPFREFGKVRGDVIKIFPLPKGEDYFVEVNLPNGLVTDKGKDLKFQHQMSGVAEIATADRRFIARLFDKLLPK